MQKIQFQEWLSAGPWRGTATRVVQYHCNTVLVRDEELWRELNKCYTYKFCVKKYGSKSGSVLVREGELRHYIVTMLILNGAGPWRGAATWVTVLWQCLYWMYWREVPHDVNAQEINEFVTDQYVVNATGIV